MYFTSQRGKPEIDYLAVLKAKIQKNKEQLSEMTPEEEGFVPIQI